LGEGHFGVARGVDVGEGSEVELGAADVHGGVAQRLADHVGDGDLLGAEADRDANLPAVADAGAGGRGLGEDVAGGDGGGVEAVLYVEIDAGLEGGRAGLADGHAGEVGDADFVAVESDAQGDCGGYKHDDQHGHGRE
jgi:hypothetical protein